VPKTLLAVDDSATMRKVFEITFSGEDYMVITAANGREALDLLAQAPSVVLVDTSLGEDAYALAKDIRGRAPAATLLLLSSRYSPYDANKGRDAGADDFIDKPFDTQQILDKVKKATLARESGATAAPAPAQAASAPASAKGTLPGGAPAIPTSSTSPSIQSPFQQPNRTQPVAIHVAPSPPAPAVAVAKPPTSVSRSHTLSFENSPYASPPAPPAPPAPAKPVAAAPPPPPAPPAPPAPAAPPAPPAPPPAPAVAAAKPVAPVAAPVAAAPVAAVASAVNGQLAGKLGELGLTSAQAEAVLALSREVVERVVWEVVPQLAETIIKEEIARLTKE